MSYTASMNVFREHFGENPKKSMDLARIVNSRHTERLKGLLSDTKPEQVSTRGMLVVVQAA